MKIHYSFPATRNMGMLISLLLIWLISAYSFFLGINYVFEAEITLRLILFIFFLLLIGLAGILTLCGLWLFFRLRYVITANHLTIELDWLQIALPLHEVQIKKQTSTIENQKSSRHKYYLLSRIPISGQTINLVWGKYIFVISPQNQTSFLSTIYRVQQLPHLQQATSKTPNDLWLVTHHPFQLQIEVLKDKAYRWTLFFNIILFTSFSGYVMWTIDQKPAETIIRYAVNEGPLENCPGPSFDICLRGDKDMLLSYVALSGVLFVLLTILSMVTYRREKISSYISLGFFSILQISLWIPITALNIIPF